MHKFQYTTLYRRSLSSLEELCNNNNHSLKQTSTMHPKGTVGIIFRVSHSKSAYFCEFLHCFLRARNAHALLQKPPK